MVKEEAEQGGNQEEAERAVTKMEVLGGQHKEIHFGMEFLMSQEDLVVNRGVRIMVAAVEVQEKPAGQTVGQQVEMEEQSVLQARIYFMVEEGQEVALERQQEETEVAALQLPHGVQVEVPAKPIQEAAVEALGLLAGVVVVLEDLVS